MKKTLIIILSFLALIHTSCSDNSIDENQTEQKNVIEINDENEEESDFNYSNITIENISETVEKYMGNSNKLSAVNDDYIVGMIELDLDLIDEYTLKMQTMGTQTDQYGIFLAKDEKAAAEIGSALDVYLKLLYENSADFNYLPEEIPKLEAAETHIKGSYVFYIIASENEVTSAVGSFDEMFKNK